MDIHEAKRLCAIPYSNDGGHQSFIRDGPNQKIEPCQGTRLPPEWANRDPISDSTWKNRHHRLNQLTEMVTRMASLYAWKITAPARSPHEKIGTLEELETYLNASGLPGANPSKTIIERTRLMQSDGQGYYKEPTNGEGWSLLWVELAVDG